MDANGIRAAKMIKTIPYHRMIRMISDKNIEDLLPWHFEDGVAYHCLSYGGIDAYSYLKFILKQQRLKYCLISSWIISPYDADEIKERVKAGDIQKIDFYVGDIFKGGYRGAYNKTLEAAEMCNLPQPLQNHCRVWREIRFCHRVLYKLECQSETGTDNYICKPGACTVV